VPRRERVKAAVSSTENGRIPLSFDYVIVAEPIDGAITDPTSQYREGDSFVPMGSEDPSEHGKSNSGDDIGEPSHSESRR